jgi:methionyl-tRNA formyltransferase
MTTERLIYFGTAEFSLPPLESLIEHGFNVVAVVTKPDSQAGRGRHVTRPSIAQQADRHNIPVLQPESLGDDFEAALAELKPTAGIVVAYGKIIPQPIIDRFPKGIINIHASLLPAYRGPSPIEAAILNGESHTGVSLMQIDAHMDTGPVFAQEAIELNGNETRPELYDRLSQLGADLLTQMLPDILEGHLKPQPQNDAEATVVPMITKADGLVDWNKTAQRLEREVRAYLGWPGSRTNLLGIDVTITKVRIAPGTGTPGEVLSDSHPDHPLFVYSCDDALIIERLKPAGKNEMTASDFLRGRNSK